MPIEVPSNRYFTQMDYIWSIRSLLQDLVFLKKIDLHLANKNWLSYSILAIYKFQSSVSQKVSLFLLIQISGLKYKDCLSKFENLLLIRTHIALMTCTWRSVASGLPRYWARVCSLMQSTVDHEDWSFHSAVNPILRSLCKLTVDTALLSMSHKIPVKSLTTQLYQYLHLLYWRSDFKVGYRQKIIVSNLSFLVSWRRLPF